MESEDSADSKKPLLMAGVTVGRPDEGRARESLHHDSRGQIVRKREIQLGARLTF